MLKHSLVDSVGKVDNKSGMGYNTCIDTEIGTDMIDKNHKYSSIVFVWKGKDSYDQCTLHRRTYDEALHVAKEFGYQEPKWWKPSTWANYLILST